MTRGEYTHQLCKRLGVEKTLHVRRAFATWMQSEGGSARNNPLNTTLHMPNSTRYNFADVQNYVSSEEGIDATVETFATPHQGYGRILQAMKENKSARTIVSIIGETNWGTAKTLMAEVLSWVARVPWVLRFLEKKEVAS
jgi:hypothetical protein